MILEVDVDSPAPPWNPVATNLSAPTENIFKELLSSINWSNNGQKDNLPSRSSNDFTNPPPGGKNWWHGHLNWVVEEHRESAWWPMCWQAKQIFSWLPWSLPMILRLAKAVTFFMLMALGSQTFKNWPSQGQNVWGVGFELNFWSNRSSGVQNLYWP